MHRVVYICVICACAAPAEGPNEDALLYLTSKTATEVVFEFDYEEGHPPNTQALDRFMAHLQTLPIDKPGGFRYVIDQTFPRPDKDTDRGELAATLRTLASGDGIAVVHILYVGGDSDAVGYAVSPDRIVVFEDVIDAACRTRVPDLSVLICEAEETNLLLHEFAHLMGLVNNGAPMVEPHEAEYHALHDNTRECTMFWTNPPDSVGRALTKIQAGEDPVMPFCNHCLDDMRRLSGR